MNKMFLKNLFEDIRKLTDIEELWSQELGEQRDIQTNSALAQLFPKGY